MGLSHFSVFREFMRQPPGFSGSSKTVICPQTRPVSLLRFTPVYCRFTGKNILSSALDKRGSLCYNTFRRQNIGDRWVRYAEVAELADAHV